MTESFDIIPCGYSRNCLFVAFVFIHQSHSPLCSCKLNIAIPIIFYGDLTYDILRTYFKSPSRKYDFIANRTEKLSLTQADAIVYPSIWIAKHAIKRYGIKTIGIVLSRKKG